MKKSPQKRILFVWMPLCLFAVLWLLFLGGIFNPWRIYRKAKNLVGVRDHRYLDDLESNTDKVTSIKIWYIDKPFSKDQQEKILNIIRRLGPYGDHWREVAPPLGDPNRQLRVDQLDFMINFPLEGNNVLVNVDQLSPSDRDAIREIIGDPKMYGITDNTDTLSVR